METDKNQIHQSFSEIKDEMLSYLDGYSSKKSVEAEQSVNFQRLQLFMDQKQKQIKDLQNHLISQFQSIENFKQKRAKLKQLLSEKVLGCIQAIRDQFRWIIKKYANVFSDISYCWAVQVSKVFEDTNRKIDTLNYRIQEQNKIIQKVKTEQINRKGKSQLQRQILKDLQNKKLKKQVNQSTPYQMMNKIQSSYNLTTILNRSLSKSKNLCNSTAQIINSSQQSSRYMKKSPLANSQIFGRQKSQQNTDRPILSEVRKNQNIKQNNRQGLDHKKYIKQKIQLLKNKQYRNNDKTWDHNQVSRRF